MAPQQAIKEAFIQHDADYVRVPIVEPASNDKASSGRIRILSCGGGVRHRQVMRTREGYVIHPDYAERGWVLLRDLYIAEDNRDGWELYKRHLEVGAGAVPGKATRRTFPDELLPREVHNRRKAADGDAFEDVFAELLSKAEKRGDEA